MKLVCRHCGETFEGNDEKFCNDGCRDAHILDIEKRIKDAVANDSSHIKKLSD